MTDVPAEIDRIVREITGEFERALTTALFKYLDAGTLADLLASFSAGRASFRVTKDGLEVLVEEEAPPAQTNN